MKHLLKAAAALLFLLFAAAGAQAQDIIYTRDGDELNVKVKEITPSIIRYMKTDNGPLYTIPRRDVSRIVYESGAEETFETRHRPDFGRSPRNDGKNGNGTGKGRRLADRSYGNNILSLALLQLTDRSAAGVGLRYERVLDRDSRISLVLPVAFSLVRDEVYSPGNGTYKNEYHPFIYFYPGARFYPAGSNRGFAYAVGPSLVIGTGKEYDYNTIYNPTSGLPYNERREYSNFRMGIMVNNSLNFMPTQHLSLGLEFGIGFMYLNEYESGYSNQNFGSGIESPLANFNFTMGYRF